MRIKRSFSYLLVLIFSVFSAMAQIEAVKMDKENRKVEVEEIIIAFKMHFDIGYTELAESILQKYTTSMMDETLRSVQETSELPQKEQFVWTLPAWPMKYILENSREENKPLINKALQDGRFRVHAFPFTFETESSDLETLVRGMSYASKINRKYNQPLVRAAKLTDVPSHSWILPTLLTQAGVKFLHIGCNAGSTSPDVPALFWWEGPDGSRLLTLNWAEYYGSDVVPPASWKYKTWLAMIHTHENTGAPQPSEVAAILKEAREKAPNAKIRIGQLEDFYDALMKENPSIPVVRGDMPDTWIHGYMSMPKEVKINKSVQRAIYNTEILNSLLKQWGVPTESIEPYVEKAIEQSLLFDEHTFGLAMSHGQQAYWEYDDDFIVERAQGNYDYIEASWYEKGMRVHRAEQYIMPPLRRDLKRLAQHIAFDGQKVVVYNPLPWNRSGGVTFFMELYKKDFQVYGVKDESTGKIIPAYNHFNYLTFCAEDVPSLGYKTYSLITSPLIGNARATSIDEGEYVLENESFKVKISRDNGSLLSIWDKRLQKEMVDNKSEFGFGEYIHEKFGDREIKSYNESYVKAGKHDWADEEMGRPSNPQLQYEMTRGRLKKIKFKQTDVLASATAFCQTEKGDKYTLTYILKEGSPYLEIDWGIQNKPAASQPEGGWLAFPFNVQAPLFRLGRIGAVVDPVKDFVKNTNQDYFFLNTGMAIINEQGAGYGLNTPNAPAVSLDRPGLFHFSGEFKPQRPNVFVNLYNNQWGTNFTEWIEGGLSAKIYVWSIDHYTNESSLITPTEETRVPLMAAYGAGCGGKLPLSSNGIALTDKGVLVTAFGMNGDGELLRLWEQAGESRECLITLPGDSYSSAQLCNLRGEPLGKPFPVIENKIIVKMKAYQPVSIILRK